MLSLPVPCQTRNFCPSCQTKRAELLAEKLREEILAPVDHTSPAVPGPRPGTSSQAGGGCESRGFVFTIPKALRGIFEREKRLLGLLSQCAFEAVKRCFCALFPGLCAVPGYVGSIQTFGAKANLDPHS